MKGPYERLKYDMRRVWECPACQHRERTPGSVTSLVCPCQEQVDVAQRRVMKLVQEGGQRLGSARGTGTPAAS